MAIISVGQGTVTSTGQAVVWNLSIAAEEISTVTVLTGGRLVVGGSPASYSSDNDFTFVCGSEEFLSSATVLSGELLNKWFAAGELSSVTVLSGVIVDSVIVGDSTSESVSLLEAVTKLGADFKLTPFQKNWVAWSKIGDVRVVPDKSNEAGRMPMEWQGWCYKVMKLGQNAVVYGENGVAVLFPVSEPVVSYGLKTLSKVGLLDKNSVAGNDETHFYIDSNGVLWELGSEGRKELGFEEFLLPLKTDSSTRVVCVWDELDRRLLVSNGSVGYVFRDGAGGGGYANVTGIGQLAGEKFVAAPASVVTPALSLATETIDFQYRGLKTITMVEVGTDTSEDLYVAVDYRFVKNGAWVTSAWKVCNPEGVAFPVVSGVEFRVRVKQTTRSTLEIDYVNVRYKIIDNRFRRGPSGGTQ